MLNQLHLQLSSCSGVELERERKTVIDQGLIDSVQGNSVVSGSSVAADSVVDFDPNAPAAGRGQGQKKRGYCFSGGFS